MPVTALALQGPRHSWTHCSDLIAKVTVGRSCACSRSEQYGVAAGRSLACRPAFSSTKAFSEPEECYSITILNSQSRWWQHDTGISHGNVVIARKNRLPMCAAFELQSFFAY
jgi:hypothetical protein